MAMRRFITLAAAIFCVGAMPIAAAMADELANLEHESTQLTAEKQQIVGQLQQSLSVKHQNEQKLKQLSQENSNLHVQAGQIDAQRPNVTAACHRTVPREQLAAAQAQCNAVQAPFNQRVDTYNRALEGYKQRHAAVLQAEQNRAAAARQLIGREKQIDTRYAAIQTRIKLLKNAKLTCTQRCMGQGSADSQSQCLQTCWDNAASGRAPVETTKEYQEEFGGTKRTPQQAIDDYKKSGRANPGPNTLKIKPVPPPPSNSN